MTREAIKKVVEGHDLTEQEAAAVMEEIMSGDATPAQIAGLITAMRMKGETVEEVTGFARVMREKSIKIPTSRKSDALIDTCGTGGDRMNTFNISTTAAFVVAGAGLAVAKHGNRAMSSKCGSADVLEALGINIALPPECIGQCVDEVGIGFMFAPAHHPSMKHALAPRKEIGIRTVFNILGPLTNPAGAKRQLIGVCEPHLTELMAGVLKRLGSDCAIVAYGLDGIDELSTLGKTKITELRDGKLTTYEISPDDVGLQTASAKDLSQGEDPTDSARILEEVLGGRPGPARDIVLLNAGAALKAAGKAGSFEEGIALSAASIDSRKALAALNRLRKLSQRLANSV
ncbi:MAG TPA: anthranilate phosphoribosyltransferase [Armatimonadota bacterium]|nr:anthranilate phosphoribosyltransferase [Armatimonadota bacterium]